MQIGIWKTAKLHFRCSSKSCSCFLYIYLHFNPLNTYQFKANFDPSHPIGCLAPFIFNTSLRKRKNRFATCRIVFTIELDWKGFSCYKGLNHKQKRFMVPFKVKMPFNNSNKFIYFDQHNNRGFLFTVTNFFFFFSFSPISSYPLTISLSIAKGLILL